VAVAGCPEKGDSIMECKEGFGGPLCAVCHEGYFKSIRDCKRCESPRVGTLAVVSFVLGLIVLVTLLLFLSWRYPHYIDNAAAFSHLKVVVSFVTVATTLDTQYGVVWPSSFAQALDAMSVLSLDFGVLLGGFCIADISFYQRLISSTLVLLVAAGAIILRSRLMSTQAAAKAQGVFVAVYLLLFAYPVLSVKIVEAFACHEVEGVRYLRADYNVRCDTQEWRVMAIYASVWMLAYVIMFPLLVLYKLWSYRDSLTTQQQAPKPELVDLHFLLNDYKSFAPALMWEVRK
jgi:hypothetical protein